MICLRHLAGTLLTLSSAALLCAAEGDDFFERRIRPILATKCQSCHGADKQFAALRLDSREAILRGGMHGTAAVPGQPDASLLVKAIKHLGPKMPMGNKLADNEIAAFEEWIRTGMAWPASANNSGGQVLPGFYSRLLREHWSYQPVKAQTVPAGSATNPVDRFLDAARKAAGLARSAPAEKRLLARRAAFVATGLPPTAAALDTFLADQSPTAWEKYVEQLLASPRYGERWARQWMDVVRYAETYGYEWNFEIQGAWRYRDYLIRAFNSDLPYNQFVREHIAGDLLPQPRTWQGRNESILATAFYRLGEMGHDNCDQFRELRTDVVDNQIDTLTKAFQGVTVSCARCHDHKIDPIPTEDYYSLYGILNSSRPSARTINQAGSNVTNTQLAETKREIRDELAKAWLADTSNIGKELQAALAAKLDLPEAAQKARGIDPQRIALWKKLLDREKLDWADPLALIANPALQAGFAKEAADRAQFNKEKFVTAADFSTGLPAGWSVEGLGLSGTASRTGDFSVSAEGSQAIGGIFPAGLFTNLTSGKFNGTVRSPLLPASKKFVSLQLLGGQLAARRIVVDNCVIGEENDLIEQGSLHWVKKSTKLAQKFPVYLELNTKTDNPRLPERDGKLKNFNEADMLLPRSFFGVTKVLLHDEDISPKPELHHLTKLAEAPTAERFADLAQAAVRAWSAQQATEAQVTWLSWLLDTGILVNSRNLTERLRLLTDRYRTEEAKLPTAEVVAGMGDFDPGTDHPIFLAGAALSPGRLAPRHFLSLMPAPLRTVGQQQSGRREMAEAIASADNPLTARLMVNRIWHYVFGRGIVTSTDDFGSNGGRPSHPELLDYLASNYMQQGWSTKRMVRLLLTSQAFQQSSAATAAAQSKDPENRLLHHYPVRRLEAEALRDTLLHVSGRLEEKLYGPSIQPYRDVPQNYRRLFQGPLDGDGRRSVYLKITRMQGPRFLEIFDFPNPLQGRGNRDVTNVPPQALALLNDPFVLDQAKQWATQLTEAKDDAIDVRLQRMFDAALGRPATAKELASWRALTLQLAGKHGQSETVLQSLPVWTDLAHAFFNLKEFLYLR